MVVAFDFEHHRETVPDINDTGVLTRPLQNFRAGGGKLAQEAARAFVATVLGPHHREDAEFFKGRGATESPQDTVILIGSETVILRDLERYRDSAWHGVSVQKRNRRACARPCRRAATPPHVQDAA